MKMHTKRTYLCLALFFALAATVTFLNLPAHPQPNVLSNFFARTQPWIYSACVVGALIRYWKQP